MLYNLTNIRVCFPSKQFLPRFLVTFTITSTRFLHVGLENVTCIFCIFTYFCNLYWNETVPELRVVSEQTHDNLHRYSNKTYEVGEIHEQTANSQIVYSTNP